MTGFRRNIAFSQRSRGVCGIQRGVYSMYVYCDVCKENIVGYTKVPLLQCPYVGITETMCVSVTRHLYTLQCSDATYRI